MSNSNLANNAKFNRMVLTTIQNHLRKYTINTTFLTYNSYSKNDFSKDLRKYNEILSINNMFIPLISSMQFGNLKTSDIAKEIVTIYNDLKNAKSSLNTQSEAIDDTIEMINFLMVKGMAYFVQYDV